MRIAGLSCLVGGIPGLLDLAPQVSQPGGHDPSRVRHARRVSGRGRLGRDLEVGRECRGGPSGVLLGHASQGLRIQGAHGGRGSPGALLGNPSGGLLAQGMICLDRGLPKGRGDRDGLAEIVATRYRDPAPAVSGGGMVFDAIPMIVQLSTVAKGQTGEPVVRVERDAIDVVGDRRGRLITVGKELVALPYAVCRGLPVILRGCGVASFRRRVGVLVRLVTVG